MTDSLPVGGPGASGPSGPYGPAPLHTTLVAWTSSPASCASCGLGSGCHLLQGDPRRHPFRSSRPSLSREREVGESSTSGSRSVSVRVHADLVGLPAAPVSSVVWSPEDVPTRVGVPFPSVSYPRQSPTRHRGFRYVVSGLSVLGSSTDINLCRKFLH